MVGVAQDEIEVICDRSRFEEAAVALFPPAPGTEIPSTSGDMLRSEIKLWIMRS